MNTLGKIAGFATFFIGGITLIIMGIGNLTSGLIPAGIGSIISGIVALMFSYNIASRD